MPIFNRRTLRQRLGVEILRDTLIGQTSGSWGTQAGSYNIIDSSLADPTASGEELYHRHWLRLLGSIGKIQDLRVGSFNTGSGSFLGAQTLATTIFSGMAFEVHGLLSPSEKDSMIDVVVQEVRVRKETPIWSIQDSHIYSLGPEILDVVDVRYFSDPTSSLNRSGSKVSHWLLAQTQSGQELRVNPSFPASYQLIVDALTSLTLGAGDLATINLPSEHLVLWGAATRCYGLLDKGSPGRETGIFSKQRKESSIEYNKLKIRFKPKIARRIQLDEVW